MDVNELDVGVVALVAVVVEDAPNDVWLEVDANELVEVDEVVDVKDVVSFEDSDGLVDNVWLWVDVDDVREELNVGVADVELVVDETVEVVEMVVDDEDWVIQTTFAG